MDEQKRKAYVQKAKSSGLSDSDIFEHLKSKESVSGYIGAAKEKGVPEKDVENHITEKYGIQPETPRTWYQSALRRLTGLVPTIGGDYLKDRFGSAEVSELANAPAAFISSALTAPRNAIDYPANLAKAEFEHWNPDLAQYSPEIDFSKPYTGFGDEIPEEGDIRGLASLYPNYQSLRDTLIAEKDRPQTAIGRGVETLSASAAGGPLGLAFGAAEIGGEAVGLSPATRSAIGLAGARRVNPSIKGKVLPKIPETPVGTPQLSQKGATIDIGGRSPPAPGRFDRFMTELMEPTPFLETKKITSTAELAAKMLTRNPENINFDVIRAANELGIPLQIIPMQTLTKGGLPNFIEGVVENSMFGSKKFNGLLKDFTREMTHNIDKVISSIPIDEIATVTPKDIGEPEFNNFLPMVLENQVPALNVPKHKTGKIGTSAIKAFETRLSSDITNAYEGVKLTDTDVLKPEDAEYRYIQRGINSARRELQSKGYQSSDRKAALAALSKVQKLYEMREKIDPETGKVVIDPKTKKPVMEKAPIRFSDIKKNLNDLNKRINYAEPSIINLITPAANAMRNVIDSAADRIPALSELKEANKLFGYKAQIFKDPIVEKLSNMTDEQFYRAVRNNPTYLGKFKEIAEKSGNRKDYDDLRGAILADILEGPMNANSPQEMASKITDKVIKEVRELEPFYPELKGLSQGLQTAKKAASALNTPRGRVKSAIRQEVMEDLVSEGDFGRTLARMNKPEGVKLVQETLNDTPQGKKIMKNLEQKKTEQLLYKGPKKTQVTLADLADVFKDPTTDAVLRHLLDKPNYDNAKRLALIAEKFEEGKATGQALKKNFEKGAIGSTAVGVGGALGTGALVGLAALSPLTIGSATVGIGLMAKWLNSKNFRENIVKELKRQEATTKSQ